MSRFAICTLVLALAATACSDTPTNPDDEEEELQPISDIYEGTLTPNGAERFSFVTAVSGVTSATIVSLNPSDAVIGLGLGTYTSSLNVCQVLLSNDKATLNTLLEGQSDRAGNLCVRVYDSTGQLTGPVAYKVQVIHN
jgi:hypothetical protein